ncbi:hypothetical protein JOC27_001869 [Sporolactobacillus spathodeae]|uniref:Uncharacterized protein n=1 Tax=Sporolactobacillus spathodeae TaxID=1465502 RepID=A0ABS2Q9F4_9BACL|nr:hypothetical protein [Sporolactobacillus spathodeae]
MQLKELRRNTCLILIKHCLNAVKGVIDSLILLPPLLHPVL